MPKIKSRPRYRKALTPALIICFIIAVILIIVFNKAFFQSVFKREVTIKPEYLENESEELWVSRYNGPADGNDWAKALVVDGFGNIYVTGESEGKTTGKDVATIKYNGKGNALWVKRYNGPVNGDDWGAFLAIDESGNVYLAGGSEGEGTGLDYLTIKYTPSGEVIWMKRYNGSGNSSDRASALAIDDSGNVYLTGESEGEGSGFDYATVKYDKNGEIVWVRRYNGSENRNDCAYALAVDAYGNVYLTGYSYGGSTRSDYLTLKYNTSGDLLWVKRFDGSQNSVDRAYALAVGISGDVYVTGYSHGDQTDKNILTIKYNSYGKLLWTKRYNGSANGLDWTHALTLDSSGNVYVAGQSHGVVTGSDFVTIKYNPSGDTLWVRIYEGPGNHNDWDLAHAIVVDDFGSIYVTGESQGTGTDLDYATIKYDLSGDLLWVRRYNQPSIDNAFALAVDPSGNVYVTGFSYGPGTTSDYATIKYGQFIRGDVNGDKTIDLADAICLANYLLKGGGQPPVPISRANSNRDDAVNLLDVIHIVSYY